MVFAEPSHRMLDRDADQFHARGERLGLGEREIAAMIAARMSTQRVEEIALAARETFGSEEKARRWLKRPTTALSDLTPLEVASAGEKGVALVVDLLNRIDHGLAV